MPQDEAAGPPTISVRIPDIPERDRDMGFGDKVARESRQRLLNRDGTFNVERTGLGLASLLNPYHFLITITWRTFFGLTVLMYFFTNVIFGLFYTSLGAGVLVDTSAAPIDNPFLRGFFFSVQTFATIGYGTIHPAGFAANLLVTVESYYSLIITALITGLMFARFARPTARIMFSERAVVAPYQDGKAFMIRLVNSRNNQLIEVNARMIFSRLVEESGEIKRRFEVLTLEREKVAFLPLALTLVHPIDEKSPMCGLTAEDFERNNAEIAVLISAMDETYAQVVHQRTSYKPHEVKVGHKFVNIYNQVETNERISIDVRKLSRTEAV